MAESNTRYRRATPAENMQVLKARLSEHLSPAEKRELDEVIAILSERLPIKPDRVEAYNFFDINLVFHSARERNEVYEWLKRQCERPD